MGNERREPGHVALPEDVRELSVSNSVVERVEKKKRLKVNGGKFTVGNLIETKSNLAKRGGAIDN